MKWTTFTFKILWLAGLFFLTLIASELEVIVHDRVSTTYNILPELWLTSCLPILFGIYISLLLIKKWSLQVDLSLLLCVCIPCLFVAFYTPVVFTADWLNGSSNSNAAPIPYWLYKLNYFGIPSVIAGFTLMLGLFSGEN